MSTSIHNERRPSANLDPTDIARSGEVAAGAQKVAELALRQGITQEQVAKPPVANTANLGALTKSDVILAT